MCRRSVSKNAYVLSDYDTGRDRESKGEVSVTSPALCHFFILLQSLIMKVHSGLSDNLSGKMIEGFYLLCRSWFSLVLRDLLITNTRLPLQRDRLAVYYVRRPGESRVHWVSFGITVLVEIGSRKDSSVVASNDNKTGEKRRHY